MLYSPPYIRSLPHSRFYCHFVFSVKTDFRRVMRARPSLLCYVHTILARPDIGANAYCHLIGRDDENILSSCINQSDDTIHLLRYLHNRREQNIVAQEVVSTNKPVAFRSVHTGIEPPFLLKKYYAITACMTRGFTSRKY